MSAAWDSRSCRAFLHQLLPQINAVRKPTFFSRSSSAFLLANPAAVLAVNPAVAPTAAPTSSVLALLTPVVTGGPIVPIFLTVVDTGFPLLATELVLEFAAFLAARTDGVPEAELATEEGLARAGAVVVEEERGLRTTGAVPVEEAEGTTRRVVLAPSAELAGGADDLDRTARVAEGALGRVEMEARGACVGRMGAGVVLGLEEREERRGARVLLAKGFLGGTVLGLRRGSLARGAFASAGLGAAVGSSGVRSE